MVHLRPAGAPHPLLTRVQLVFPNIFPQHFARQTVGVDRRRLGRLVPVVSWPPAVPLYGSEGNPPASTPGSQDSAVLGQTGSWAWVALKGPQYPLLYPHDGPLVFAFRQWDRIVALNPSTGADRLYRIPPSYTLANSQPLAPPSLAWSGSYVYVAVGHWLGRLSLDPKARVRVLGPGAAFIRQQGAEALGMLRFLYAQEVNSLAAYGTAWREPMCPAFPPGPMTRRGT